MAIARTITLDQLADRIAEAADSVQRDLGLGHEDLATVLSHSTIIGRTVRDVGKIDLTNVMSGAAKVAAQVNELAHGAVGQGREAVPVLHWPGHGPLIWGFILRDFELPFAIR